MLLLLLLLLSCLVRSFLLCGVRKKGDKEDNSNDDEKDDRDLVRPPAGPKLSVVCYTRSSLAKGAMAGTWMWCGRMYNIYCWV